MKGVEDLKLFTYPVKETRQFEIRNFTLRPASDLKWDRVFVGDVEYPLVAH